MTVWPVAALDDLCSIALGATPPRGSSRFWDKDKSTSNVWLSIADLPTTLHAKVSDSKEYLSNEGAARGRIVKEGTLLVSFKLTLGRLAYAACDLRTNEAIAALSIKDAKRIEKEYLYWYLTYFDWQKAAEGEDKVKGKTLNKEKLKVLPVLVPPLEEQRRIVAVLDEAFAAIATSTANAEKNLANARELARHTLLAKTQERSREVRRLEEVSVVDWGNTNLTKSAYVNDGSALAVSAAGCDGRIGHAEHGAGVPVLSAIGARCGRMFFPEEPFTAIKNTITITPRQGEADGKFLFYLLSSINLPQRGSAQPFIAKGDINKFKVPIPSLDDQRALVVEIDSMFELCDELEMISASRLRSLTELEQSLLHRAFSGELTEREPLAA